MAEETVFTNIWGVVGINYKATSFDSFKESGFYGIDFCYCFRTGGDSSKLFLGGEFHWNYNMGLVEKEYATTQFGLGGCPMYYFNENFQFLCPVSIDMNILSYEMEKLLDKKLIWGIEIVPQICFFKYLNVGLLFCKSFESGGEFSTGLYLSVNFFSGFDRKKQ